ncbi:NADP-dependent oxidoreductase [Paraburkholderia rhizosphaerae]|uniref:NADPH:quinone reductase-like Zn-dependent oxidoreductase n=1 Tax=Paraburkholderia rhizosphaerae TaxID=480658 RepID=A0A4R8LLZ8_9BURK|nr:NADP-dependent oxidoreductase [Paraburkholderia rhizosphaerae]TDY43898.1 NADPH:quinone reductase-like Zn-dependent oxidoreductase [Paraburkholderia rhizosphaerae]
MSDTQSPSTSTMHAYRIHHFGGPDALEFDSIAIPEPGPDEVLVQVLAAGVNPVDVKTREGHYPMIRDDALPYTLGRDFAGKVVRAGGKHALQWRTGQQVFGFVGQGQGAFADFVVVDATALAEPPHTVDIATAGAVPLAALTAWQGLFEHGLLERGERVLVHAAAGGVGHLAVQFAREKGAEVFATASGDGVDFVRSLGVDNVIDYRTQRFEDIARDMDLVFDLVGGDTQSRSWAVVKRGGALISTLTEPSQTEAAKRGARGARYTARPDGSQLNTIAALIDAGRVKVRVAQRFGVRDLKQAFARIEAGHVHGKLVAEAGRTETGR